MDISSIQIRECGEIYKLKKGEYQLQDRRSGWFSTNTNIVKCLLLRQCFNTSNISSTLFHYFSYVQDLYGFLV